MLLNNLQRTIKGIGLSLSLIVGLVLLSSIGVSAQYRDSGDYSQNHQHDRRDNRQEDSRDRRDNQRDDGRVNRRGNDGNYNNNGYYRNNSSRNGGYYGNNDYYGNNGYGNNVYQVAQQNGYNDGLNKGAEDAREGHNDPQGTSLYRNATNGYNSYGNRGAYQQAYRQAFLQGFREGFNQNYNNRSYGNRNGGYGSNNGAGSVLRQIILGN